MIMKLIFIVLAIVLPSVLNAQDCSNIVLENSPASIGVNNMETRTFISRTTYIDLQKCMFLDPENSNKLGIKAVINPGGRVELFVYLHNDSSDFAGTGIVHCLLESTSMNEYNCQFSRNNYADFPLLARGNYITNSWESNDIEKILMPTAAKLDKMTQRSSIEPLEEKTFVVVVKIKITDATVYGIKIPGLLGLDYEPIRENEWNLIFETTAEECNISATETRAERIKRIFTNPLKYPNYVIVAAHRGYWKDVPENSIASYDRAIAIGADMVELDVRLTKDDTLVAFHDACLERITTGTGFLRDKNWSEIEQLYLKDRYGNPTQYKMLSIRQVLSHLKDSILINFDIKEKTRESYLTTLKASIKIARELNMLDQLVIKYNKFKPAEVDSLLAIAETSLDEIMFTPVAFGNTKDMKSYVTDYINKPNIHAIELVYKTDYDPILDMISPTKTNNVRVGTYTFWPEECGGVWAEDSISKYNDCSVGANQRDYEFTYSQVQPGNLNDGRGDWDWIMKHKANFLITDRPALLIDYLDRHELRNEMAPLIEEAIE